MFLRLPLIVFILSTAVGSVLAAVPTIVYRGASKKPTQVKEEGGLNCYQPTSYRSDITVKMHITKNFKINGKNVSPMKDPWVSTTFDYTTLISSTHATSSGYIYKIDTTGRENSFVNSYDVDFGPNGHPYASEKEVSAWVNIPWVTIMGWSRQGSTTYTVNPDYAGSCGQTGALRKRGLVGPCAMRRAGAGLAPARGKPNAVPAGKANPAAVAGMKLGSA